MDSWQVLLIYISAAVISLMVGSLAGMLIGRAVFKAWSWRRLFISKINLNKLGILKNESPNQHSEVQMITDSAKSEEQTFSPAYGNKQLLSKQGALTPVYGLSQHKAELLESTRNYLEVKAEMQMEIERLNEEIARSSREKNDQVAGEVVKETKQKTKAVRKTRKIVIPSVKRQAVGLNEINTNLRIATTPWDGKPSPFQTKIWDTKMSEFDSLITEHGSDLGQAYIDMAMANQIVWLCTEIGYKSDDLESSYKQLCTKIAERLLRCAINVTPLIIPEVRPSPLSFTGTSP